MGYQIDNLGPGRQGGDYKQRQSKNIQTQDSNLHPGLEIPIDVR